MIDGQKSHLDQEMKWTFDFIWT